MSKKMMGLQQALNSAATAQTARPEKPPLQPKPAPDSTTKPQGKAPSRQGKENIGTWLHPDFKKSLRLVQLRKSDKVYLDDLVAEALNDLFLKYNVPTVNHD
ncbi:MAG TPA: ribbon-helix-helix domain-containing protein [Candidatus Binataceae bacterium]|nr:ribbon-helix-helix domain-containing protein [Candidatus Binataceae bacterium]